MPTTWRVNNSTSLGGEVCAPWTTGHAYALGARVVCRIAYATVAARAFVYECTDAGTSHAATEPTWPLVVGNTVVEDTADDVTWTCRSPGDGSWDNASCYLPYIMNHAAAAAGGDTILIDDGHNEAGAWGTSFTLKGSTSEANPTKIFCVDKADDSISTGAVVLLSMSAYFYGCYFTGTTYSYGVTFNTDSFVYFADATNPLYWCFEGSGTTNLIGLTNAGSNCTLNLSATNAKGCKIELRNGSINSVRIANYITCNAGSAMFIWKGGTFSGAAGATNLFYPDASSGFILKVADVDLDNIGAGATATSILRLDNKHQCEISFTRCKLPADAGFVPVNSTALTHDIGKVNFHHCSSGNRYYDFLEQSYKGTTADETTIVRTGGASDGTTAQAWKMVSSANTLDNINALESPPITIWNSATTEKTFTIECIWDSEANIEDDEIWMELEYPVDNTSGLGAVANDKCAILGAAADQATSVLDWENEDDLTNPNTFKLSVTVTPGKAGPVTARVYLAKASTTVYVDPLITIT